MTPRGTLRAITLDRNYSKEKWLYNKKQLDELSPEMSKKDIERSKSLKKISKRQSRQRVQKEAQLERNRTFYSSMSSKLGGGRAKNNESKTVTIDNTVNTTMA